MNKLSFDTFIETKKLFHDENLSQDQLSSMITETAIDTSSLLSEMGYVQADNFTYRNAYVNHPSVEDIVEGQIMPDSTVQTYSVTESEFKKIATSIELTNEVMTYPKFNIQENTKTLVSSASSSKIASIVLLDIKARETETPTTGEHIKKIKTGSINFEIILDEKLYDKLSSVIKAVPDVYNTNSKLYLNKNNFVDFVARTANMVYNIELFTNGLLLGIWPVVIVDQLDDNTVYFGDMESCFDLVSVTGNITVNDVSKPDITKITSTGNIANVAKDSKALVALVAEV